MAGEGLASEMFPLTSFTGVLDCASVALAAFEASVDGTSSSDCLLHLSYKIVKELSMRQCLIYRSYDMC